MHAGLSSIGEVPSLESILWELCRSFTAMGKSFYINFALRTNPDFDKNDFHRIRGPEVLE